MKAGRADGSDERISRGERAKRGVGWNDRDGSVDGIWRRDCLRGGDGRQRYHRHIGKIAGELRHLLILVALAVENAGAAANHKLLRGLIGETEPRSEIVMIAIHDRAAVSVLAGQRVLAILNVEQTAEIARIHRLGEQLI